MTQISVTRTISCIDVTSSSTTTNQRRPGWSRDQAVTSSRPCHVTSSTTTKTSPATDPPPVLPTSYVLKSVKYYTFLTLPYLTFGVGRLLHLPSAEAVSVRPNAQPWCNQRSQWSAVKPNKSPATWDWWRVVWLFLSGGLRLAPLLQITNRPGHRCISPTTTTRWQTSVGRDTFLRHSACLEPSVMRYHFAELRWITTWDGGHLWRRLEFLKMLKVHLADSKEWTN